MLILIASLALLLRVCSHAHGGFVVWVRFQGAAASAVGFHFIVIARRLHMQIRDVLPHEHTKLGQLMVEVYSHLEGFPSPADQPAYYDMLANIGSFTTKRGARVLVAVSTREELMGGVVYFADMSQYGSDGSATRESDASGIRLLGVHPHARGQGIGKSLTLACIELARQARHNQVILHTTQPMRTAWAMYERFGFQRSPDLDFMQQGFPVHGFRLRLPT
jgi:GNAT superfamily N-acetyltransferase